MKWLQVTLNVPISALEEVETILLESGAIAISLADAGDQPLYEPAPDETPLWTFTRLTGLFAAPISVPQLLADIRGRLISDQPFEIHAEELADECWERVWLRYFKPMVFGTSLWIIPEGFAVPDASATNIFLDPGLAFGTGTHETTALCLRWLATHPPLNKSVIDYGCGSGILAISAAKLGAAMVTAVDIDPQALLATEQNAIKNACLNRIRVLPVAKIPLVQVDLILANILAQPLIELVSHFNSLLCDGGILVLSGILAEQQTAVSQTYARFFPVIETEIDNSWVRLVCRRHP